MLTIPSPLGLMRCLGPTTLPVFSPFCPGHGRVVVGKHREKGIITESENGLGWKGP